MPRTRGTRQDPLARSAEDAVEEAAAEEEEEEEPSKGTTGNDAEDEPEEEPSAGPSSVDARSIVTSEEKKQLTMEERIAKMKELRQRMATSSKANRKAVASETNRHRNNAKQNLAMSRKMEKAEKELDKRDAMERGEDWERVRALEYSIEDNERWEKSLEDKEERRDKGYIDPHSASERTYRRLVSQIKPDMRSYNDQRAKAMGMEQQQQQQQQQTSSSSSSSTALTARSASSSQLVKHDDLYADYNNLRYGSHKPDDAAMDRVAAHLNAEADVRAKRSRRRAEDPDAEVDYINEKNKHYNKKIKRAFHDHVQEIRDSFERGTAL